HGARLGAGAHVDLLLAVEGLELERRAERGGGHRQRDPAVQVVALPGEHRMLALAHLDVEVARRPAARAYLALPGQPDPHAVLDAGRNLDGDGAAGPHPALAA